MDTTLVLVLVLVGAAVAGVGAAFIVIPVRRLMRARRQRAWPSVTGTVIETGLRQATLRRRGGLAVSRSGSGGSSDLSVGARHLYLPDVAYEYAVEGETYRGRSLGGATSGQGYPRRRAEKMLAEYRPGGGVEVFYDPQDPTESVLKPGRGGVAGIVLVAVGLVWLLFGAGILFGAYAVATGS